MRIKHFATAALAAFPLAVIVGDVASEEYDPVTEMVSRYVNTSTGWVTVLGLFCLAAGTGLTAWRMRSKLLGACAIAIAVAAAFPADPPGNWSNQSTSDTIHGVVALLAFAGLAVVAARKGNRALGWTAVAATVLMFVTLVDVMTVRGLPMFLGVTERLALLAYVAWMITTNWKGDRDALEA